MPATIKGKPVAFELDDKRFYIPGFKLQDICPKCKTKYEKDYKENYIMYPKANSTIKDTLYCNNDNCGHEWEVKVKINVSIEIVK